MGKLLAGTATDTGRVREHNEDMVSVAEIDSAQVAARGFLVAVADGMGGHERGEIASTLAIEALFTSFYGEGEGAVAAKGGEPARLAFAALEDGFKRANERIIEETINGEGGGTMGTTMVAAVIIGDHLTVANVGDSRAYLVRAEKAEPITKDHSLVAEQVAGGVMTAEEARTSNYRNIITRALGHRPKVEVDIFEIALLPDDRIVLCSDGVHGSVEPEEVADLVLHNSPSEASQALIDLAMEHGSTDNVTAAVITYEPAAEAVEVAAGPTEAGGRRLSPVLLLVVLSVVIAVVLVVVYLVLNM